MNSYLFSVGDSAQDTVGFCARVFAESEKEALEKLVDHIDNQYRGCIDTQPTQEIEYFNFYVNTNRISIDDIDEVDLNVDD